jgi:hypothetical protein
MGQSMERSLTEIGCEKKCPVYAAVIDARLLI